MAINRETIRISDGIKVTITGYVDGVTRDLVRGWARAWDELEAEWRAAAAELTTLRNDGRWPTRRQIALATQTRRALELTYAEILNLTNLGGVWVTTVANEIAALEDDWQRTLLASQYPPAAGGTSVVAATFNRVDEYALGAIVERTTENVTSAMRPLSDEATEAMKRELVRGVALGENPRAAADRMVRRVEGRFNGGLTRALNIARTEILDAHRSAAAASQFENADVMAGWTWAATLDTRTCPSCWAQHGTEHPLEEIGPIDHHQGRCARLPKAKTWRELGFDIDEPPSVLPDAQQRFDSLPEADQLQIMGPVRLQAYRTGGLQWHELSVRTTNDGWRDSRVPISVGAARKTLVTSAG